MTTTPEVISGVWRHCGVYDSGAPTTVCEAYLPSGERCKQNNVRYVHLVECLTPDGVRSVHSVGRVCAARLTGADVITLKASERSAGQVSRLKLRFMNAWRLSAKGNPMCRWREWTLVAMANATSEATSGEATSGTTWRLSVLFPKALAWRNGSLVYPSLDAAKAQAWLVVSGQAVTLASTST